jgi:probable HAF family extracellular repeat protein
MVALGTLPDFSAQSFAMDVSSDGLVVAGVSSQDTQSRFIQSSRWRGGALEPLDRFADNQLAHAISSDGSVVVGTLGQEAFRWEGGDSERLGFLPGGESSFATSVSPNGSSVVGFARNADGAFQAFRWENGEMVGLESAPGEDSLARDVSADGSVVVGSVRGPAGEEAVRWVQDPVSGDFRVAERLGVLSADSPCSEALAISADGSVVVGYSGDTANFCHGQAFIWTEDEGMRGVRFVLETEHNLDLFGWTLGADISVVLDADISNDGTVIVGTGTNPDGEIEAWRAFLGAPATRLRR